MARGNGNGWSTLVLIVAILVYAVYFAGAYYTFTHLPPLPDEVRTEDGKVLFTKDDIIQGKYIVQRYGLQDYGSFLGFGGYFGPDYTAYVAEFIRESAMAEKLAGPGDVASTVKVDIVNEGGKTVFIVNTPAAKGYEAAVEYFTKLFRDKYVNDRLAVDKLLSDEDIRKAVAFFTWDALIAIKGYTNGFPYTPGLIEPHLSVTKATWVTIFTLLLVIMPIAGYIIVKSIDYWRDERITVQLPPPSPAQRVALLGFVLAVLGNR